MINNDRQNRRKQHDENHLPMWLRSEPYFMCRQLMRQLLHGLLLLCFVYAFFHSEMTEIHVFMFALFSLHNRTVQCTYNRNRRKIFKLPLVSFTIIIEN